MNFQITIIHKIYDICFNNDITCHSNYQIFFLKNKFMEVEKLLVDDGSSGNSSSQQPKKSIAKVYNAMVPMIILQNKIKC